MSNLESSDAPDGPEPLTQAHWLSWGALLFLFLLTRFFAWQQMGASIFGTHLLKDAASYHLLAQFMAADVWQQEHAYFFSPGYPILLGAWYWMTDSTPAMGRLLNVLLSLGIVALLGFTVRRMCGNRAAIIAGFAWVLCESAIFFEQLILTEIASGAALMGVVALGVWLLQERSGRSRTVLLGALGGGVLLGLAALFRTNFVVIGFVLVGLAAWKLFRDGRRRLLIPAAVVYLLGMALAILPCTIHNWRAEGEFIPISSNFGINLYIGNNPTAIGVYDAPPSVLEEDRGAPAVIVALHEPDPSSRTIDRYWRAEAWKFIRGNPGQFGLLLLRKAALLIHRFEFPQIYHLDSMRDEIPILKIPLLNYGLLFPFAVAGGIALLRGRTSSGRFVVWSLVLLMVSLLPFFITERYRFAFLPLLIVPASMGVELLLNFVQNRAPETGRTFLLGFAIGVFLSWIPWIEFDPRFHGLLQATRERGAEFKAALLFDVDDIEGAEAILSGLPVESLSPVGLLQLARVRETQLRFCDAADLLARATDQLPTESSLWFYRADAERLCGRREDAHHSYIRAFSLDPFLPIEGLLDFGALSYDLGDFRAAAGVAQFALERDPGNMIAQRLLGEAIHRLELEARQGS